VEVTDDDIDEGERMDTLDSAFPPPPFAPTDLLRPICSWSNMAREMRVTGVDFDEHWYSSIMEEVAYFYEWHGLTRATVLVVIDDKSIVCVEAREFDDQLVSDIELLLILEEIATVSCLPININCDRPHLH
jgi:hypothetical protein